jgi:hypothetical protein
LGFNEKKFEDIKTSFAVVDQKLDKLLAEYQDSLVSNKNYKFDLKELPI